MMKNTITLILVLATYIVSAQDTLKVYFNAQNTKLNSWHLAQEYNGSKIYHGDFCVFNKSGELTERGTYALGQLHGTYTTFYAADSKSLECRYTNGILNGEHKMYYPSGNIKERALYINGKRQGACKKFPDTKDAKPNSVVNYKMGKVAQ